MNESIFAHKLAPETVLKKIEPLKDKEPAPAWRKMLNDILKEYHVSMRLVIDLAIKSNKRNELGRHYGKHSFDNVLQHYKECDNGWTENAQKTVNDHLDILAEYLIDPDLAAKVPEQVTFETEPPVLSLRERLEKERAEGKWPSVEERIAENNEGMASAAKKLALHFHRVTKKLNEPILSSIPEYDGLGKPDHVKVKPRKAHKKHIHKRHHVRKIVIYI